MNLLKDPLFQALFNASIPRIILKPNAPDFTIVAVNDAHEKITGKKEVDIAGQNLWEIYKPEHSAADGQQQLLEALIQATTTSQTITMSPFQYDIIPGNAETMENTWWKLEVMPIKGTGGNPVYVMITAINITEDLKTRKKIGQAKAREHQFSAELAASEARAKYIFSVAPVAIGILSGKELIIESANDKILKIWGKQAFVVGQPLCVALPEIEGQPFLQLLDKVFSSGMTYYGHEIKAKLEHEGQMKDVYLDFVYHPLADVKGNTSSIMVVATEVTGQVQSRKTIERTEEMLRLAIDSVELGTWYINLETREFIPSDRLKNFFGFDSDEEMSYDEAIGQIEESYRERVSNAIEKSIVNHEIFNFEFPIMDRHDGRTRWCRATGKLYAGDLEKTPHFSGTILDITGRKEDEQRKDDFISMVSHELKTPLTSLSAYIQMLVNKSMTTNDDFVQHALGRANQQVKKMGNMINGFLNVSRLGSGRIYLNINDFNLKELILEVIEEIQLVTPTHAINLHPCDDVLISGDRDKIGQVVTNLLSNAAKYSPRGNTIDLTCTMNGSTAVISVKDEGMGVKPQDIDKLFNRFYRVSSKHTENISGFGIGLYLSAEIIKSHHGRIWVESEKGKGSTFFFSLPL